MFLLGEINDGYIIRDILFLNNLIKTKFINLIKNIKIISRKIQIFDCRIKIVYTKQ